MILNILIIVLILGVAYFHYAQGFFGATISAVCAICAATIAIGYHEVIVNSILKGAAAEYADAMVMLALFALVYIIMRVLSDKAIPGAISLPVILDRAGGAIMGIVAAIFTGGIVALAAQAMPFGPSIGGFARYPLEDRPEMNIPAAKGRQSQRTADVNEQLVENRFEPGNRKTLWIPADDIVVNFVAMMSNGGSLSGSQALTAVHPNYPDELFAQRLGIQVGAKKVAINLEGKTPQVSLPEKAVFRIDADLSKGAVDAELPQLHQRALTAKKPPLQLVIRVMFTKDAGDPDGHVRLSPGSVRLVAAGTNYWPIGTLEAGKTLFLNKMDDFIFVNIKEADHGADFVFDIDDPANVVSGTAKENNQKIKDGVFLEVKRLAKIDLSGQVVIGGVQPSKDVLVERKEGVGPKKPAEPAPGEAAAVPPATEFVYVKGDISNKIFSPINTGSADANIKNAQIASGTLSTVNGQLSQLEINTTQSLRILAQGSYAKDELYVPATLKMVQIQGTPPAEGGDPWAWAQLSKWQLIGTDGKAYKAAGGWAKVSLDNSERMVASYNAVDHPNDISGTEGRPLDVYIAFLVPPGAQLKSVKFDNKMVKDDLGVTVQ